mmetsp:Transcript_12544/g.31693  ORF Transcript_12544/g.31693 Transcript_12544/m.31693 type:complete len:437 (+) Transcript_12544:48-1358(+)
MAKATKVGPYILSDVLGQGAFGKVMLGTHKDTKKEYAVKILDKAQIKQQDLTPNVKREIAIMKALNHRNIVNLRDVLNSPKKLYIVMDLVRGGEILGLIERRGGLDEKIARRYFQQLVDGVEYCHRRGIYHRDIKPENLLVDQDGTLKITDFGVSSMKPGATDQLLFTSVGTPFYAAPELLGETKSGYQGSKVDAWSIGVILFLLLTGELPFHDDNMTKLYKLIQQARPTYPAKFPAAAKDLCSIMLVRDPEKRADLSSVRKHPWFLVDYTGGDNDGNVKKGSAAGSTDKPPAGGSTTNEKLNMSASGKYIIAGNSSSEKLSQQFDPDAENASFMSIRRPSDMSTLSEGAGQGVKDITAEFEGKEMLDFVQAAVGGKTEKKINDIIEKLSDIDIDCVGDLQAIADEQGNPDKIKAWLEGQSIPSVTALRIANMFKA